MSWNPAPQDATPDESDLDFTHELHNGGSESPVDAPVPYWITACLRFAPPPLERSADKVLTLVQALMGARIRAGEDDVELDRYLLALFAGMDKRWCRELLRWLVQIGFLEITKRYVPGTGHRLSDSFRIYPSPPPNYTGPRTFADLARALTGPRPLGWADLFAGEENRRSEPRGRNRPLGLEPKGTEPSTRPQNRRSEPRGRNRPLGLEPKGTEPSTRPQNRRSEPRGRNRPLASDQIEREGETSRSLPIDRESVPPARGAAGDALVEDELTAALRTLVVDELPWDAWATTTGRSVAITREAVDSLAAVMRRAIDSGRVTLDQVRRIATEALPDAKSTPMRYLTNAFTDRLDSWLERIDVVRVVEPQAAAPAPAASSALPECATCGAREGEGVAYRSVEITDEHGRIRATRCPDCLPYPENRR